jgi:formate dehydrogenase beta subunit
VVTTGTSLFSAEPAKHGTDGIFQELKEIQRQFGYLPSEQIELVARERGLHIRDVHQVASFYPHFHLTPPAKVDLRICGDMTCHLRGAGELKAAIKQRTAGMSDKDVSLRDVSCLGRCDTAPAIEINDHILDNMTEARVATLIEDVLEGRPLPEQHFHPQAVTLKSDPYSDSDHYAVTRNLVASRDFAGVIAALKAGGLRGMGGAGFPTGNKWEMVRNAPGPEKYIVCNADESEPGTIKDRFIMSYLPHLLVEGMLLAGLVTGAHRGYLYIRHEYELPAEVLQHEIDHCYAAGILGKNVLGSGLAFDLQLFISPGGYICGEESALLEAIEGKRSEPRNKPPFPVLVGLWNKPTVINNVETFTFATVILARGADWFKQQGVNGSAGIKFVGISGDVVNPGVFEVPMGTTYEELIYSYAGGPPDGKPLIGFAPSGPSSGYLPASMLNLRLDWNEVAAAGSMVGSGAIVVCAEGRCMLDMALNSVRFFRNESCGKCVPCRVGSQKMVDMLTNWTQNKPAPGDMALLDELCHAMAMTSICGLGQIVPAPIQSVIKHFRADVDEHLLNQACPAGVCFRGVA